MVGGYYMDYIYGKLNQQVEKLKYKGKKTDTATVNVDNKNGTISVDVNSYSPKEIDEKVKQLYSEIYKVSLKLNDNIDEVNKEFSSVNLKFESIDKVLLEMSNKLDEMDKKIKIPKIVDEVLDLGVYDEA